MAIILSVRDEAEVVRAFVAKGAAEYVLQSRAVTDFNAIIEHVLVCNGYILPDASAYDLPPKHR